ncbi:carbohydrate kinase family protein [Chitinibacter bivalviorum]|uniref:Carbohydrate kinase family protein n=1 Tax=Chitinibacter bivalviorum TaxID=2739434 RepID=A0A7H9BL93_9NEIS|nr:carbohydrate kinase family protein [Chitinibacter bivalviorum]QLG89038.1 carbohydrate kinase family protein [Chitinibacter bivalviorum]
MSALICGSMAYDTIMVFPDHFKKHILPEQIHILSVSFLVPEMRRELGGCAGNIAYTLKMLGSEPLIMATVGQDFGIYEKWLDQLQISRKYITEQEGFTGQCFITTDLDDNQITAFHPGAMGVSHLNQVSDVTETIKIGIVSPDGKQGMQDHARQLAAASVPFIFDPGQGMPMFSGEELLELVELATYLTLNDYEAEMMSKATGLSLEQLASKVKALVVTLGAEGATIYADGTCYEIPAVPAAAVLDPTGCGDAFRAGLLHGLMQGWDWPTTGRLASLLGSIKIAHRGGQNHKFNMSDLAAQYQTAFGQTLPQ